MNMSPVSRLKKTWAKVKTAKFDVLEVGEARLAVKEHFAPGGCDSSVGPGPDHREGPSPSPPRGRKGPWQGGGISRTADESSPG